MGKEKEQEKEQDEKKNHGNTGLPFGLCKKFGIELPKDATPEYAWKQLEKRGLTPNMAYEQLKENQMVELPDKKGDIKVVDAKEKLGNEELKSKLLEKKEEEEPKKKNTYSQYLKGLDLKDKKYFYGDSFEYVTNKYFWFDHILDDDNFIICTENIKNIKDNYVMIVDNNKGVYLKDWQVRKIHNWDKGFNGYAVKLNRKYFKPYTFNFNFNDMSFEKEDTFDSLMEDAKSQRKTSYASGHIG